MKEKAFWELSSTKGEIPTTLDGPFEPMTVPLDKSSRGHAVDLPHNDPRLQRNVTGFEPEQISVSLSATFDSVWISWITGEYQIGFNITPLDSKSVKSIVRFGTERTNLTSVACGDSLIYSQLYPFEGFQNYTSGIIHHTRLTGLAPNTRYYYQCGDPSIPAMSDVFHLKTMPVTGPKNYPSRIAIIGDTGLTYNTTSTIDHMVSNKPDLIVLVGDVSYANLYHTNGTLVLEKPSIPETYQPRWDYWGRYMQPVISKVPIMVTEGNHEEEIQAANNSFVAYRSRFAVPYKESRSHSPMYYSYNVGGIHFLMLGSYANYNKSGEQYNWLKNDLAKIDRNVTPWLVAIWHAPWYSTYVSHYNEASCMRLQMEDLLYRSGVDLVFTGHVHAYERSNRVYNYTLNSCGPVHITVGDAGNKEDIVITHADEPGKCPDRALAEEHIIGVNCASNFSSGPAAGRYCWDRQPEYSAYRDSSFGHGILEIKNETHALWTWHRNQDAYTKVGDQIYIVRQPQKCKLSI